MMIIRMVTIITRMMSVVVVTVDFLHMTELIPELMRMRVAIMIIMMIYDPLWMIELVAGMMKMIAEVNMGIVCQGC